ncbi:ubiquitin-related domain-containing protein [Glomus cerebriforme]|uniref:Ubiquitin-related domain-containing protein n=1 Tax=Glomus cerebriforme TaxID=658196 RepID=A0A397SVU2_9GLOM|nr:ubiquitin-related domain-containing protein [Glomus cerebriforme]
MSLVDETNFVTNFLSSLSSRPVRYPQDFAPPLQTRQKPTPNVLSKKSTGKSRLQETSQNVEPAQEEIPIQVKIKSLKGGQTLIVQLNNSDTILNLKEKLQPLTSIPVNNQRLILKGKALVDIKTLYEYGIDNDTTIHLVQKSGSAPASSTTTDKLSPPVSSNSAQESPISLNEQKLTSAATEKLKDPQFWRALRIFLQDQFSQNSDVDHVFQEFLNVYKEFNGKIIEDFDKQSKTAE